MGISGRDCVVFEFLDLICTGALASIIAINNGPSQHYKSVDIFLLIRTQVILSKNKKINIS